VPVSSVRQNPALLREAVEVGGEDRVLAHEADGLTAELVGEDEEEVGGLSSLAFGVRGCFASHQRRFSAPQSRAVGKQIGENVRFGTVPPYHMSSNCDALE